MTDLHVLVCGDVFIEWIVDRQESLLLRDQRGHRRDGLGHGCQTVHGVKLQGLLGVHVFVAVQLTKQYLAVLHDAKRRAANLAAVNIRLHAGIDQGVQFFNVEFFHDIPFLNKQGLSHGCDSPCGTVM